MKTRFAEMSEVHALAETWYAGWQDAHAQIVPAALAKVRTLESFEERLIADLPSGAPSERWVRPQACAGSRRTSSINSTSRASRAGWASRPC